MGVFVSLGVGAVVAVVATCGHTHLRYSDNGCNVFARERKIALKGGFDADTPPLATRIGASTVNFATNIHQVIFTPRALHQSGSQIHNVAFGYGVEVDFHARVALVYGVSIGGDFFVAHKVEQRVDVDGIVGILARKAEGLHKRLNGYVVGSIG